MRRRFFILMLIAVVLIIAVSFTAVPDLLVEYLWMQELGYAFVFWKLLTVKILLFCCPAMVVFACIFWSLMIAVRRSFAFGEQREIVLADQSTYAVTATPGKASLLCSVLALLPALLFGRIFSAFWDSTIRFAWGGSYGMADPLYGNDIGFYLFRLPLYEFLQNGLAGMILTALLLTAGVYLLQALTRKSGGSAAAFPAAGSRHLYLLLALLVASWGWGFYLDRFALLYSATGAVYGAGYTDTVIVRAGLLAVTVISGLFALCLALAALRRKALFAYAGFGVYLAAVVVALVALPAAIQKFIVRPNELELETPYLEHNIRLTREAYGLDAIEDRNYPGRISQLTQADVEANRETLKNIRLWDWRPLIQTFRQLQEIRLYYSFYEVDVDRYYLDKNDYRQVMLSARELAERLPDKAATWVNRHLQFTHGYGAVMSHVSRSSGEGLPEFILQDLPPRSAAPGITVDRAALYYGEKMSGFRIVNTGVKEFDYPKGDENVYTSYAGSGGVPIDSLWKRLLYAWAFSDINILFTNYITDGSRIQYRRPLKERISSIAPFLQLDNDPYLVISEGRCFWIQDAYTVSTEFPYSEPLRGINYIRNSVKVVVDAYEGSVVLYAVQPDEPVLQAYAAAFPGLFVSAEKMPEELRAHIRYPQDLFSVQANMYRTYHMTVPQVFYNREDLWTLPQEKYAGSSVLVEPYYILIKLPGAETLEYLIMSPLTPENRDNMIAWLAAKCDEPDYGRLLLYQLPKERLIYGPMQIEAMIDQDDRISQKLSLWDQRGSKVIRGNLLVIPMAGSFLYVEPVYLIAEENDIPQLKRVIGVYGKKVVMQKTLEDVIAALTGEQEPAPPEELDRPAQVPAGELLRSIRDQLGRAEEALQEGDWSSFGKAMDRLKKELLEAEP